MDNVFLLTLLFIFLTALISAYIARRKRDLCLKDMEEFHVTIEMKDGHIIWGQLAVFPNGLEAFYKLPHRDNLGHLKTSVILFKSQLDDIQAIYRYHDELSQSNKEKRQLEILRTYHPGLHRQSARALRSLLNIFRDALNESIGFVISSVKEKSTVIKTQDKRLTKIGETVVGATTSNAYEPILERYIGRRIVAEEIRGDKQLLEYPGILKEYSGQWLELLDCLLRQEHTFDLSQPERLKLNHDLDFIIQKQAGDKSGLTLSVENYGEETLQVKRFEAENYSQTVEAALPPHESVTIDLSDLPKTIFEKIPLENIPPEIALRAEERANADNTLPAEIPALPSLRLVVEAVREGDICLPRPHAFVRHGAEAPNDDWLKSSWRSFLPWIQAHRWRTVGRCLWIVFNLSLASLFAWAIAAGLDWGNGIFKLIFGLIVGLLYGGAWLIQWSMVIHDEHDYAHRLKQRLGLITELMILIILWFIWRFLWALGG